MYDIIQLINAQLLLVYFLNYKKKLISFPICYHSTESLLGKNYKIPQRKKVNADKFTASILIKLETVCLSLR